jgi:nucleotide-binding universal stress UspA family protein
MAGPGSDSQEDRAAAEHGMATGPMGLTGDQCCCKPERVVLESEARSDRRNELGADMHNAIAVGVCDSSASRTAIRWAVRRASLTGAAVELLHVLDPHAGQEDPEDHGRRTALAHDLLIREVRFARSLASGVAVGATLLRGSVMWELTRASTEADLVVVGTHKTGFIHGAVYGSTSLQLAVAAHCPVVVVPGGMSAGPLSVVVGADESPAGHAAFAAAVGEASATGQDLVIVRVWKATEGVGDSDTDETDEAARNVAQRLLTAFAAMARATHPGLTVRVRAVEGFSAPALVRASAMAQLLVLGSSRGARLDSPVLGAVCHDALMNIVSPTAIVHVDEDRAVEGLAGHPGAVLNPIR